MKRLSFWVFILMAELIAILDGCVFSLYANRLLNSFDSEAFYLAIFLGVVPTLITGGLLWLATHLRRGYDRKDKIAALVLLLLNVALLCLMFFGPLRMPSDTTMLFLMTGYLLFAVFTPCRR